MKKPANGRTGMWLLVATLCFSGLIGAQEAPTPLNVEVVFSKYQGDKLTARLPYMLMVNAEDEPESTHLRMGIEVPVILSSDAGVQYRNVGTNIDCKARPLGDGRFQVKLVVEQSSMYPAESGTSESDNRRPVEGNPLFRTFNSNYSVILRDGEKRELTAATDPVSGEVSKVQVSLEVLRK